MINVPKGTKDVLPSESFKWHYVEKAAAKTAELFGLKEIRTPVFEHTELFLRGVGETTDIVNKEMYTFTDKGGRSVTLKPEGTAGVARCFIENALFNAPLPLKTYYITPVFRYEKPQSGRLREHHQFGVEIFGSYSAKTDAEVIMIAKTLFDTLGLKNLELNINNIGCPKCRAGYNAALKKYFADRIDGMCKSCKERLEKNPLRILDCKEEQCKKAVSGAPSVSDYLCDDCLAHRKELEDTLDLLGVEYKVNPNIVRGLDYYTGTVFEFISKDIGAQGTVCGGGRYNNLVEEVGGKSVPAVGFGMGLERLILTLEGLGLMPAHDGGVKIYLASIGDKAQKEVLKLTYELRKHGISADCDCMDRSVKAQMKYADKTAAEYTAVIGDDEIEAAAAELKNMANGSVSRIAFKDITRFLKDN